MSTEASPPAAAECPSLRSALADLSLAVADLGASLAALRADFQAFASRAEQPAPQQQRQHADESAHRL